MSASAPFLSVVIPAYNEEKRLGNILGAIEERLQREPSLDMEILVVDDGSKDGTLRLVEEWQQRLPTLRASKNPRNMGKGATIRRGMLEATGQWRLFADADNSTPFEQVDNLLRVAQESGASVVVGSRACKGARLDRRQPWRREMMGRVFNLLVQAIALPGIKDTQCGFKLFSAEAAEAIFPRLTRQGFSFDVEALYLARRLGFGVEEAPARWLDDAHSKVNPVTDSFKMFLDLLRIRWIHAGVRPDWSGAHEESSAFHKRAKSGEAKAVSVSPPAESAKKS
jgi:dolichyl-phosphate beta-glucosyltransferase